MIAVLLAAGAVPAADTSPAAARAVVERYYAAIEHGRFHTAYRLWAGDGQASGQSYAQFARGFARTAHSRVVAGRPTDGEGAAGSLYISVPVTVTAQLKNGARQRFRGTYILRRVDDVPGATAEQLRWRIASARLRPA